MWCDVLAGVKNAEQYNLFYWCFIADSWLFTSYNCFINQKMENIGNGLENRDVIRNSIFHLHSGD